MAEPLLQQDPRRRWFFSRGKHAGEFLDDVASENKEYVRWLYEDSGIEWDREASLALLRALED